MLVIVTPLKKSHKVRPFWKGVQSKPILRGQQRSPWVFFTTKIFILGARSSKLEQLGVGNSEGGTRAKFPGFRFFPNITMFPCKYHQNGGFSMAMLVLGRVNIRSTGLVVWEICGNGRFLEAVFWECLENWGNPCQPYFGAVVLVMRDYLG